MKERYYLLLVEGFEKCRDCDEWLGIFHDDDTLKAAYEDAVALPAEHYDENYRVAIYEFIAPEGKTQITWDWAMQGQRLRRIDPEELECFPKTSQEVME